MGKKHASQYANFGSLQQLYLKYHLTDEEIAFIGKMIKPM